MAHRDLKDKMYPQFARIAQALASDKRLELVDLLSQAPRHVDALAHETGMSLANVSQHLQVLRGARLVESQRLGNTIVYRLADPSVTHLWLALRTMAESRLAEVKQFAGECLSGRDDGNQVSRDVAAALARQNAILLDVRPREEFEAGHLRGAINIPIDELAGRLAELPRGQRIITYCRGKYCLFADEAADLLNENGFDVVRLEGGWPEWQTEGRPIVTGGVN
jgi:rhodanese-related sulfurtransferase